MLNSSCLGNKYADYQPSAISWAAEIPSHWEVKALKYVAKLQSGDTIRPEQFTEAGYPVYGGNGFRGYTSTFNGVGRLPLIGRQGALCGNVNYSEGEFFASEHAVVVRPKIPTSITWLGESIRVAGFNRLSQSTAQPGISVGVVENELFPVPPLSEQKAISSFIEQKSRSIGKAISVKEKQITLLKERKQILIQNAVTRGLNPDAPMRDSGIEWIGEIPAHWRVEMGKRLFFKAERKVREDDEIITCFRDGEVTLRKNRREDGFTNALKEHGYQGVKKGDLIIHAMDAFAGAVGVSDSDGKSSPVYSACVPRDEAQVESKFFAFFIRNLAFTGFIQSLAKGIRERSTDFRFRDFANMQLAVPPKTEQIAIVCYIETESQRIDHVMDLQQRQIDCLKEYNETLIKAVVTGKFKVPTI